MEDTLGVSYLDEKQLKAIVLILVLMEDTLGEVHKNNYSRRVQVLILVIMEDTLGERFAVPKRLQSICLNPCSNGRYSRRPQWYRKEGDGIVLILVLMEDTLGGATTEWVKLADNVLILILMEDTLGVSMFSFCLCSRRLNPCSNGRYSRS